MPNGVPTSASGMCSLLYSMRRVTKQTSSNLWLWAPLNLTETVLA